LQKQKGFLFKHTPGLTNIAEYFCQPSLQSALFRGYLLVLLFGSPQEFDLHEFLAA
jgi:hypothetical protein